jgi:uncharacterized protein (DUF3084 family)
MARHEARTEADLELRDEKIEKREREVAEREQRLGQRQNDLAAYVGELQDKLDERETDWWRKQLGAEPESLSA